MTLQLAILTILSIFTIITILLQKSSSMGLGAYQSDSKIDINGDTMTKITGVLVFFWLSDILYISYIINSSNQSILAG